MAIFNTPPTFNAVVDSSQKSTLPWVLWFNNEVQGDPGESWSPTFVGLTESGTVSISGVYYIVSNYLAFFRINIVPSGSATTASTAGSTYINNFPLKINGANTFGVISGNAVAGLGTTNPSTSYLYTPGWAASNDQFVLSGVVEAT